MPPSILPQCPAPGCPWNKIAWKVYPFPSVVHPPQSENPISLGCKPSRSSFCSKPLTKASKALPALAHPPLHLTSPPSTLPWFTGLHSFQFSNTCHGGPSQGPCTCCPLPPGMLLDLYLYNSGLTFHFLTMGPKNQCPRPQPCLHPIHFLHIPCHHLKPPGAWFNVGLSHWSVSPSEVRARGAAVQACTHWVQPMRAEIVRSGHSTQARCHVGGRAGTGGHVWRGISRGQQVSRPLPKPPPLRLRAHLQPRGSSAREVGEASTLSPGCAPAHWRPRLGREVVRGCRRSEPLGRPPCTPPPAAACCELLRSPPPGLGPAWAVASCPPRRCRPPTSSLKSCTTR